MITSLTQEQTEMLTVVRDEWMAIGLSTGPVDKAAALEAIHLAYQAADLKPPTYAIWMDSPVAGAVTAARLATEEPNPRGDQVGDQVYRACYGVHEAGWLARMDALGRIGATGTERLKGHMDAARAGVGWWFPFEDAVVITPRPSVLNRDGQGRLHCEDGPAILYPDGWGIWAWHGTVVPRDLIEEGWDLQQIFSEPNAEIRRCAIEKVGWDHFVEHSGIKRVATAPDPGNPGYEITLYDLPEQLTDLYDAEARILLCVNGTVERDGTRRRFGLPVPAHHNDPVEAAADLYGWSVEDYRSLEVRR